METRSRRTSATKSPDVKSLEKAIERLEGEVESDSPADVEVSGSYKLFRQDLLTLLQAGKWTCEHLTDRRIYHKKQQAKKREWERIARRMLAKDEVAAIEAKVAGMSALELLGPLDDEAEEILLEGPEGPKDPLAEPEGDD